MSWEKEIAGRYGEEYLFRQLAEESAEMTQAALKLVRVINEETPVRWSDAQRRLMEEIADVEVMLHIIKVAAINDEGNEQITRIYRAKVERMKERLL